MDIGEAKRILRNATGTQVDVIWTEWTVAGWIAIDSSGTSYGLRYAGPISDATLRSLIHFTFCPEFC
jgi:hypothetical protein